MSLFQSYSDYFVVSQKNGLSQFQTMTAYLGGSAFQTVLDNPVTAYRQLVQQYAKDAAGKAVDPKVATAEATAVFKANPAAAALSGLMPRLIGVGFKRVPKFGILLGLSFFMGEDGSIGVKAAFGASVLSAPFINPIRMIEKQQRAFFKTTGVEKPIMEILRESAKQNFVPLFRGTVPLMGHSCASALLGLAGQPKLQKYLKEELSQHGIGTFTSGLLASAAVTPIYVGVTNPLSRLEVIMQTSKIDGKAIGVIEACKEVANDSKQFGMRGIFRGQGLGIAKGILSLTAFHQGRIWLTDAFRDRNISNGSYTPKDKVGSA
eukprot:CAMPEP_0181118064 /NCGR_PEP_ID=MMETSP1071-20121207/22872_1 /TAXON_ID=35127 /ORGANISM="Thalassiosira sp., Strain NH16" /LENGTH=319 /DNA_ID=CAMNT_0023202525 /DNA_START=172 /DNA_END=1131 /DNA_ORIENTATION=+